MGVVSFLGLKTHTCKKTPQHTIAGKKSIFSTPPDIVKEARIGVRCLLDRSHATAVAAKDGTPAAAVAIQVRACLFEEGVMSAPSAVPVPSPHRKPGVDAGGDGGVVEGGWGEGSVVQASCTTSGSYVGLYLKVESQTRGLSVISWPRTLVYLIAGWCLGSGSCMAWARVGGQGFRGP